MKRLECLDGVRGLLAVYVLLGHMAPFAVLPGWLQGAVSHGGAAVDVFFVLSGLVIAQSLSHAGGRAAPFLIARAFRIFPVFLPVFAVAVATAPLSCGFEHMPWVGTDNTARTICAMEWPHRWLPEIAAHLTMTHGLFPNAILPDVWVSFLGSAWSLSTEWQFYIVALLITRTALPSSPRLYWTLLGVAVLGAAWRLLGTEAWQFSRAFLLNKAHFFALGVASVPVVRGERHAIVRYLAVLLLVMAICATQGSFGKLLPPLVWTLCLLTQMRPATPGLRLAARAAAGPIGGFLGAISYCLYLVNEPIHKLLAPALGRLAGNDSALFTALWIPAAIGLPILLAMWLHRHVEAPALRWGRGMAGRSVPGVGA